MKLKSYLLRAAIGVAAFVFGICLFSAAKYVKSYFEQAKPKLTAQISVERKPEIECVQPTDATEQPVGARDEFEPSGEYVTVEDLPEQFNDFYGFAVRMLDYENTSDEFPYGKPIPPEGFIYHGERQLKFARVAIGGRQISFVTEAKKGITYKFTGEFLETDKWELVEELNSSVVLKGVLRKLRNGQQIAKTAIRLTFDESCSC